MKSIEKQLSLSLGLSLLVVFVLLWWLAVWTMHHLAEDYILERLHLDADAITQHLYVQNQKLTLSEPSLNPAYSAAYSGHYYVVKGPHNSLNSSSINTFPIYLKPPVPSGQSQHYETLGPNNNHLLVYQISLQFKGQSLAIYVAEDHADIEQALWLFDAIMAMFVLLSLALIHALQQRLLHRSFKRLDPIYRALDQIQDNKAFALEPKDYPQEVQPLVAKLNQSIQSAQSQLQRSRQASSNLAHSLKTPLNILFQLRQHPVIAQDPTLLTPLKEQTDKIYQRLETELQAAKIASDASNFLHFSPEKDLNDLIQSLQQLYPNKTLHVSPPLSQWPTHLPLEQNDGFELLGNLLDNAAKFGQQHYWLTYHSKQTCFYIEDDGPGVARENTSRITQRGFRLDSSHPGHGVGLAIVNQITDAYAIALNFQASRQGGLSVHVCFPKKGFKK